MATNRSPYLLLYGLFTCQCVSAISQYSAYSMYGTVVTTNLNTSATLARNDYAKANFGSSLPTDSSKYFNGVLHEPYTPDDCTNFSKPPNNTDAHWIALVHRSVPHAKKTCSFIDKVYAGQLLGYSAVIIYDYEFDEDGISPMYSDNDTLTRLVSIPSVFVSYTTGIEMCEQSYNKPTDQMVMAEFHPFGGEFIDPYKILIPMAFSFIGILLVAIIVMIVRWCHAFRRRRRSRISKSQLRKLPLVEYKDGDQYDCCAICLDDYEAGEKVRQLPCSHTYHKKCIDPWLLKNKRTCPVCKRRVVPKKPRRRPARLSDSSESDDPEAFRTERHPLLGPPAGRDAQSSESDEEVRGYGATGAMQSSLARISEESTGGATGYSPPRNSQPRRTLPTQRPSHFADDEDSDECEDLRNPVDLLAASSVSSRLADSHSLQTLSHDSTLYPLLPLPDVSEAQRTADLRRAIDIEDSIERDEPNNGDDVHLLASDSNQNVII